MKHKCTLCNFETDEESKLMEHQMKDHAASNDKFMT